MEGQVNCFGKTEEVDSKPISFIMQLFAAMKPLKVSQLFDLIPLSLNKEDDYSKYHHDSGNGKILLVRHR
jgi:hypothetical protein